MSTTAKRRRKQAPPDLLDPTGIVDLEAERDCLAALIDIIDREPVAVAVACDTLTPAAFTMTWGAEIFRAITAAIKKPKATRSDVLEALAAEAARQQLDAGDAKAIVFDLANDKYATGPGAERVAAERAADVRELYARRQAVDALGDALRRVHDERPMPDELEVAARRVTDAAALAAGRKGAQRRLRVRSAAEIQPQPIEWLWPKRISRGSLTIITGMPGLSKSLLTIDIAARITTGGRWPDGTGAAPTGGVILFGMEDPAEQVVVPRLQAAAADLDLVRIVDGAEDNRQEWLTPVNIERDLDLVREQLDAFPQCQAIIFDPLSQFVECDENSNAQTRAALAPLVKLAQDRGVSIIGVMHLNKKTDSSMIQRIAGASSYGQLARHIIFVGHDPDDPTTGMERRRAMIVAKSSYGGQDTGQLYRVVARDRDQPGIEWIAGTVERDAESLNPKPPGVNREYQEKRGEAVDALRDALARGPRPAREVEAELETFGYRRRQVDYAVRALNVRKYQARDDNGRRTWTWSLPLGDAAEPDELPEAGMVALDNWRPPK